MDPMSPALRLAAVLMASLPVMLIVGFVLSMLARRPFGPVARAVLFFWLVATAAFGAGVVVAVLFFDELSDRVIVFALTFLGVLVPFVVRSGTFKALK